MQIDFAGLEPTNGDLDALSARLRSQVCIVGGGIAGLTVAHRLVEEGVQVTLLEAGGRRPQAPDGSDPFEAELLGEPHAGTRDGRVRALGGCSVTWGGQLLPLPEDVKWPVSLAELEPFQFEAERMLGVDTLPYEARAFFAAVRAPEPSVLPLLPELRPRLSKFVPFARRNLAHTLGRTLLNSPHATVPLHAQVTELVLAPRGERIEAALCRTPGGLPVRVEADAFVLAAGTVESCRLLLASNTIAPGGIGNAHSQLGRNFHDHLTLSAATFTGRARARLVRELRPWIVRAGSGAGTLHSLKLEPVPGLRRERGWQATMAHLTFEEPESSGMEVVRSLLRARQSGSLVESLGKTGGRLPGAVVEALRLAWAAGVQGRRYISSAAAVRLQLNTAQGTRSTSRVLLGDERDGRGMRKAIVAWHRSPAELETLRGFAAYLRGRLDEAGPNEGAHWTPGLFAEGELVSPGLDDARHAMGGACMGTDPRTSVVDPQLRVHGIGNLSVASAAVLPDGSAQLPTLTLVALALRLAARLRRELA